MKKNTLNDLVLQYPSKREAETVLTFLDFNGQEQSTYSFGQLAEYCSNAAQNLLLYSNKQEVVLISLAAQDQFVAGFFGCLMAGKVPAPLPPLQQKQSKPSWGRLLSVFRQHKKASLLIAEDQFTEVVDFMAKHGLQNTRIYTIESLLRPTSIRQELPVPQAEDLAYIQYTSGSTDRPKGILLTHQQVLHNLAKMKAVFASKSVLRVAGWLPFHHDMGLVGHLFSILYQAGFGVFMQPTAFLAQPRLWLQVIEKYQITCAAAPTFAFDYCCSKIDDPTDLDLSSWEQAHVGSETVSLPVLERFVQHFQVAGFKSQTFRPVYGLAEATLLTAGGHKNLDELRTECLEKTVGAGSSRTLIPYTFDPKWTNISIHDPDSGAVLADDMEGEIWIESAHNFAGYWQTSSNFDNLSTQIVKTGDRGFLRGNKLYISGRSEELIIVRGVNYATLDLEHALRRGQDHLQTNDATVCLTLAQADKDELLILQEIHRHTGSDDQQAVVQQIRANLADSFGIQAKAIVLVPRGTLARTGNYKLARNQCLQQYLDGKLRILYSTVKSSVSRSSNNDIADDPVVVVGMACRFPGGVNSPEEFWELLSEGRDGIVEVPNDRWDKERFYDEKVAVPGKANTKWGGFIDQIDHFDPILFGISPYEASEMDPQQRLILETSWRLLEHSGWKKIQLKNSKTGVFIGISTNDYLSMKIKLTSGMDSFNAYSGLGNAHSVAANRLSYIYDLKGPSVAIDTACSSSLTAFHLGAAAILNKECEQAIVGGVNAMLSPGSTVTLSQFGMMAPDGRCKTFDANANGYVRAEGCGLVMLKRRSAALRDGDNILATVLATAAAQDGKSPGITYPNGEAQRQLIADTISRAGCDPQEITYVEAHGTGTSSGDPIEVSQIVDQYGTKGETCYLGSVKASIGHLEAGAGIASVIKAVLMLQKRQIPPQLHLKELNPKIQLTHSRMAITDRLLPWESIHEERKLAISSFGFGGALAHAIFAEAPPVPVPVNNTPSDYHTYPFVLSGYNQDHLRLQVQQWIDWLLTKPVIPFPDLCSTQANHRTLLPCRTFVVAADKEKLIQQLSEFIEQGKPGNVQSEDPKLCFLFTGQGEYYPRMGRSLYYRFPRYKQYYDYCVNSLELPDQDRILFDRALEKDYINDIREQDIQPIQFALQYALGRFLIDLGLQPDYLLGYSFGEYAAACLAGCFDAKTGMAIAYRRGQLMDQLEQNGLMITVFAPQDEVAKLIKPEEACIAVINSDKKTVVSGNQYEIQRLSEVLKEQKIEFYYLKTIRAYHSPYVEPMLDEFSEFLSSFTFREPSKKWLSSVTGGKMEDAPGPEHWIRQTRHAVQFANAAQQLEDVKDRLSLVEIGPGASTLSAVFDNISPRGIIMARTLAQDKPNRPEGYYFLNTLGQLNTHGFEVDWQAFYQHQAYPAHIPGQCFQQQAYWIRNIDLDLLAAYTNNSYTKDGKGGYTMHTSGQQAISYPQAAEQSSQLHYQMRWSHHSNLPDIDLDEVIREAVVWIVVGEDSPMLQEMLQKIKSGQKAAYWLGPKTKGKNRPDQELSAQADTEEFYQLIDKICLLAPQGIRDFRILFVSSEQKTESESYSNADVQQSLEQTVGTLASMFQALSKLVVIAPVWVITQGLQRIDAITIEQRSMQLSAMWGFAQTAFLEHPEWRGGLIDIDPSATPAEKASHILCKVLRPQQERCVVLREGKQYIEYIEPAALPEKEEVTLRTDGAYLITGGLGGLGLASADWLANKGIPHLILLSRRTLSPQTEWGKLAEDHPHFDTIAQLLPLRAKTARLEVVSADVRDLDALSDIITTLDKEDIPLRGVLHAAGVNTFSKLKDLPVSELLETIQIKMTSAWALHLLTRERSLDCFLLFSSVAALWGSAELSHYTAANYYLDMLARHRREIGLPALSINWGPWAETGMSVKPGVQEGLEKLGFKLMAPDLALSSMEVVMNTEEGLYLVADVDWNTFKPFVDFSLRPSLFTKITRTAKRSKLPTSEALHKLYTSSPEEARQMIENVIRTELRRVMLVESANPLDAEQRFNFMGMDSLMAISFVVEVEQYFNIKLPNTLPYNYPHIKAVTGYLFDEVYLSNQTYTGEEENADEATHIKEAEVEVETSEQSPEAPPNGNWVPLLRAATTASQHHLYCFPYAGSGVSVYNRLAQELPGYLTIFGIQPPGREERSKEEIYTNMQDLIDNLIDNFNPPDEPYSLFGHSVGGLMAYELYLALERAGKRLPECLIISASGGLMEESATTLHQLPDDEMITQILHYFENQQVTEQRRLAVNSIKELVRADLQLFETYKPAKTNVRIPMVVIAGNEDPIAPPEHVKDWLQLADQDFRFYQLNGKHDLVQQARPELARIIAQAIPALQAVSNHPN